MDRYDVRNKTQARRSFTYNADKVHKKNYVARPMRGGYRL